MLEPTRVTIEVSMTDEITGLRTSTRYRLIEAIYHKLGSSEFHSENVGWIYEKLDAAVQEHLKNEGNNTR